MAGENQEQVVEQTPVAKPNNGQQEPVQKVSILDSLGSMLTPSDRAKLAETEKKIAATPAPTDKKITPPEEKKPEVKAEEKKPEEKKPAAEEKKPEEKKPEVKADEEPEVKSKFGLGKKKGEAPIIENEAQLIETINKDFGFSAKEIKDTGKFFEQTKDWRTKAQQYEETAKKLKETEDALVALPEPVIQAMQAFYKGEDYRKPFLDIPNLDFDKAAEKQNKIELVKTYFPKQFAKLTEDQIEELKDGNVPEEVEPLLDASITKFTTQQESRNSQRATQIQRAEQQQKAYKASVSSSVENLEQSFPGLDKEVVTEATTILTGGMKELQKLFLNGDGTLKKDAAKRIMMAIHGEDEMKKLAKIEAHKAETKAHEEILSRGTDKPTPKKGGNGTPAPQISKELQKQIEDLGTGYGQKKTF